MKYPQIHPLFIKLFFLFNQRPRDLKIGVVHVSACVEIEKKTFFGTEFQIDT